MAHPHGCWLETSVPPHVYHAIKLHRCLYSMACGFLQREGPRNRLQRKQQCPVTGSSKSRTVTFFLSSFFFFFSVILVFFFLFEMSHQVQPTLKRKWTVVWEYALYGFSPLKVKTLLKAHYVINFVTLPVCLKRQLLGSVFYMCFPITCSYLYAY